MSKHAVIQALQNQHTLSRNIGANAERTTVPDFFDNRVCVQRDSTATAVEENAPALVRETLQASGVPLDSGLRATMEPRFEFDFSNVRVHTDDLAAESARAVSAKAYTAGHHVVFAPETYSPSTVEGQNLVAHELTHVVQQSSGPVYGKPATQDLSVSDPSDRFEQHARETAAAVGSIANAESARSTADASSLAHRPGPMVVQRQPQDTSPPSNYLERQTIAGESSARAGESSARAGWLAAIAGGISALGGLVSAIEAIRQANYAKLQAEASIDPPVATPTTGGLTSTHVELPEVKGEDKEKVRIIEKQIAREGITGSSEIESEKKTKSGRSTIKEKSNVKQPRYTDVAKLTERETTKVEDSTELEKQFRVLRIEEGASNSAEFLLNLRYTRDKDEDTPGKSSGEAGQQKGKVRGGDIKGGATEDGDIAGYLGGTANSNATVAFRASPGAPIDSTGSVRLLFGGTNVPPRKKPPSVGFWGAGFFGGSYDENKNYKVQRFSGSMRFIAGGDSNDSPASHLRDVSEANLHVNPKETNSVSVGDGQTRPVYTVRLNATPGGSPTASQEKQTSGTPLASVGAPPPKG